MLLVPNYLSQQPQYPAPLNWKHPLLQQAEFVLLGSQPFYNPTNRVLTRGGSVVTKPSVRGMAQEVSASNYTSYPLPTANGGTGEWTVAALLMPVSGWSTFAENVIGVCEAPGNATFDRGIQRQSGTTDWAAYLYDGALKKSGSGVVPVVGRMDCVIAATDASTLMCAVNGVDGTAAAVSNGGFTGYSSAEFCVGHASSTTGAAVTQFALVVRTLKYWPPALRKMFADNPWQIFQAPPIDIWVPSAGAGSQNLTPSLVTNTSSFYAATITTGTVDLTPGLFTDTNAFYSHVVSLASGPQTLLPNLFSNSNSFYSASVTTGSVDLTPLLFTNSSSFYSPTVSLGGVALLPSLFSNTNSFYAPTVSPGLVNLVASLFTNSSTFYGHTVAQPSLQNLTPGLYSNSQTFYAHSISAGTTLSSADLLAIADAVWAHPEALTVAKFLGLK